MSIISSLQNFGSDIYNFFFGSNTTNQRNDTKNRSIPKKVDLTFNETINRDLTKGLWHNSVPGFKLGAPLCYNPIAVPLAFMGVPHTDLEDWEKINNPDFWKEKIKFYNEKFILAKKITQLLCHRDGTVWKWPWFDSKAGFVRWKTIFPDEVNNKKTIIDIDTEEIIQLATSVRYEFYDNGQLYNFEEERIYTTKFITITRTGSIPPGMNNQDIRRNPIGILPIRFINNGEPKELEGHSDYERIIPIIKAYSSINLRTHETEQNMRPKQVQKTDDPGQWKTNNSHLYNGDDYIDISCVDLVLNKFEEDTKFEVPKGLNDNAIALMNLDFWLIVQSSAVPEMLWGLISTGNHASAKENMNMLLSYVYGKRTQADEPYLKLITATLQLEALANTQVLPEGIKNTWDNLSILSEVEKAQVFSDYATGLEKLMSSYGIDLQSVHKFLYELTNGMITADFDEFAEQVKEYGTMKAFLEEGGYTGMREDQDQQDQALQNLGKPSENLKEILKKMGIKHHLLGKSDVEKEPCQGGNGNGNKAGN